MHMGMHKDAARSTGSKATHACMRAHVQACWPQLCGKRADACTACLRAVKPREIDPQLAAAPAEARHQGEELRVYWGRRKQGRCG